MKKIFLFAAVLFAAVSLQARQNIITDGNGLSWWTAASQAQTGDTLVFAVDTISWSYDIDLPCAMTFINQEGMSPVLNMPAKFTVSNAITVKGITFVGNGSNDVFRFVSGTDYDATFDYCVFKNFHYGIRIYADSVQLKKLTVNDCLFDGFDACAITAVKGKTAPGVVKNVAITNSTIMNGGSSEAAVYIHDHDDNATTIGPEVLIDHCSFYNMASGNYGLYLHKIGAQATISNCIVSNPDAIATSAPAPYYGYDGCKVKNCLWWNCKAGVRSGSDTTAIINANPLYVDPDNGDLHLQAGSPAIGAATDSSNLGDPFWSSQKKTLIEVAPGTGTLAAAVAEAQDGDTLVLSTGDYVEADAIEINNFINIIAGEEQKPVIKAGSHFTLNKGGIIIAGVKLDAENTGDYLISVNGNESMNIILQACEICNYKKYMININTKYHVDTVIIDNCFIHDMARSVIYCYPNESANLLPGCSFFMMTNSTSSNMGSVSGVANIFIRNNSLDTENAHEPEVYIDQVTMYNVQAEYGMVKTDGGKVTITNSIMDLTRTGKPALALATSGTVSNTLFFDTDKGAEATFTDCIEGQDPMFIDAAKQNFQLNWNSPAIGAGNEGFDLGDLRWGVAERPVLSVDTLKNSEATLAGPKIALTDGIITWNDQSDPTLNSATWTVNLEAGEYAVVIKQTTGSGHNFTLTASFGGNVVGSVSEGADSWSDGEITLKGTFVAAATGAYTLVLTNGTQWSSANAVYVVLKRYEATAVEDVITPAVKAVKFIQNGTLYILRDGVLYDVMGARL